MVDFEKLHIWIRSKDLAVEVYELTKALPDSEKFGLMNQMRRCAVSISANIAEGAGRKTKKDFSHFLSISMGSLN